MPVTQTEGFNFRKIDLQKIHIPEDALRIHSIIKQKGVRNPVYDRFNVVGQSVFGMEAKINNGVSWPNDVSLGNFIRGNGEIIIIVGKNRDGNLLRFRNLDGCLGNGTSLG